MNPNGRRLRRVFERLVSRHDHHDFLAREVSSRLFERLDYLKIQPTRILDLGAGSGKDAESLQARFPDTSLLSLDFTLALLKRQDTAPRKKWWPWHRKAPHYKICADAGAMPLKTDTMDVVWANLLLPWCSPDTVFREARRVLKAGGVFLFTALGPDTLHELRRATLPESAGRLPEHPAFMDMHDLGDALMHAGLADPVMEREDLLLTYPDAVTLLTDLRGMGLLGITRPEKGLRGRTALDRTLARYEPLRKNGCLPATFEIVYGHAWKPLPRTTSGGRPIIDIQAQ